MLRERDIAQRFRAHQKAANGSIVAVPFWGEGAIKSLGFAPGLKARVICNLASVACNPWVIDELRRMKGIQVRSHPRLHAKIYAANGFVIVGSSNALANGLALEGRELSSWIEANILTDDEDLVASVKKLFEEIWESDETTRVSASSIRAAKEARAPKPSSSFGRATTLLAACRARPELFKSVFVLAYDQPLGPKGDDALTKLLQSGAVNSENGIGIAEIRKAWGYQVMIEPGSWIVDLDCRKADAPRVLGCSAAFRPKNLSLKADGENDVIVTIRGIVEVPGFSSKLRLSSEEKAELITNARRLLELDQPVPLPRVVRMLKGAGSARPKIHL
jgi:hypothetical protein